MLDSVTVANLPAGADAYAGYIDGGFQTFHLLKRLFPAARLLSIAVFASGDAECLDIENGDATPAQAPSWVRRQHARGITRPVLYANAATMPAVVDALGGIPRASYRLWSAHYDSGHGAHICGPATCAFPRVPACDGTQWRDNAPGAGGSKVDESLLRPDFFGPAKPPQPVKKYHPEEPMILFKGAGARTPVALQNNVIRHRFATSGQASIRIDFLGVTDKSADLTVGYDNSPDGAANPDGCKAVIIHRVDGGNNDVSYCPVT